MDIKLTIAKKLYGKDIKDILSLKKDYLSKSGWIASINSGEVVDKDLNPLAWYSYPAIYFLSSKLNKNLSVFEFGSGNSTCYFARMCKDVVSFESDIVWYERVLEKTRDIKNSKIFHKSRKEYYNPDIDKKFDIVVVDGVFRNECCESSIKILKDDGVIILVHPEIPPPPQQTTCFIANLIQNYSPETG